VDRPVLVFDGDCTFCRRWAERGRRLLAGRVDFQPWQAVARAYPEIPVADFQRGVQFIAPDGQVWNNAAAALHALAMRPRWGWVLGAYDRVPGVAPLTEALYRFVANHRPFFSRLDQRLTGTKHSPPET
jgi:predicted DCC family thiol-disulfide oxidoreductase YuxK